IPAGGDEITKALVTRLDMSFAAAEQAKRSLGIVTVGVAPEHRPIVEVVHEATGQLLNGLRNTLNYFVNARQQDAIGRILLTGGGSKLPGFEAALGEITRVQVSADDGFGGVKVLRAAEKAATAGRTGMTVALGLASGSKA